MTTEQKLISVNEAAAILGKHPVSIRKMLASGALPAIHDSGHVYIPADAVNRLLSPVCLQCGQAFKPGRYSARMEYCTPECRWNAANERKREANPVTRGRGRPAKEYPRGSTPVPERLKAAFNLASE